MSVGIRLSDACYRAPCHDVMGYLSAHWPKPPSPQDQFGYRLSPSPKINSAIAFSAMARLFQPQLGTIAEG
ncbi:hypothetical protein E2C01_001952 [Portunus trituberculatus]|uniref:Uncharacterized protein n=1 Tax=Portunus trituberculatus TaxID=210409 RepID=A0A5B7CJ97_PORTR|nr:hypothetical protein [Portunus trituberculatus]